MAWMMYGIEGAGICGGWRFFCCILMEVYTRIHEIYAALTVDSGIIVFRGSWPLLQSGNYDKLRKIVCLKLELVIGVGNGRKGVEEEDGWLG